MTPASDVDLDRVPAELRDELAELLPVALGACLAVEDFVERYERLAAKWTTERYPQLAAPGRPADLDGTLANAAGFGAVSAATGDFDLDEVRHVHAELVQTMRRLGIDHTGGPEALPAPADIPRE